MKNTTDSFAKAYYTYCTIS